MQSPHPTKHEVIAAIRQAFSGVDREDGVMLHEADVIDSYGTDAEREAARLRDTDRIWEQVPARDIERFQSALSFLDPKGFRYYLPAFMVWALNPHGEELDAVRPLFHIERLHTRWETDRRRLALLNDAQRRAIALFLLYFTTSYVHGHGARTALQHFWGRYLPEEYRAFANV